MKLSLPPLLGMLCVGMLLTTGACATMQQATPTTGTTDARIDCVNWKTLSYSLKNDSPETVREIIENNARRAVACPK